MNDTHTADTPHRSSHWPLLLAAAVVSGLTVLSSSFLESVEGQVTASIKADLVVVSDRIAWDQPAYTATATNGKVVIELRNDDLVGHNLHAVAADGKDSGTVLDANPKATDSGAFTLAPGVYTLICTIPGHSNMKATLTVK